jgi:hypothetical protein
MPSVSIHLLARLIVAALLAGVLAGPLVVLASAERGGVAVAAVRNPDPKSQQTSAPADGNALQDAAERAGEMGRTVALSLIGLALAAAAVMLVFRRDFKEAVGVFAVGLLAVLLATPAGLRLLRNTAELLFGGQ